MATLRDEDFTKTSNFDRTFKQVRKVNDPRFGEAMLFQDPTNRQQILVRERKYNDKTEAGRAIQSARARIANQNPNTLRMLDYSATKQSELCSTIYVVRQYWELPANDLKRELQNRITANAPFTEPELSNILYQTVRADPSGLHGDISPINIAYDKNSGTAKLIDKSDEVPSPQRTVNLQKSKIIGAGQNLYQSPIMYNNLKRNNLKFGYDPTKEDAFALGLTMLELGNLKPVSNIYNAGTKEVDRNALQAHLTEFRNRYPNPNGFLTSTVDGLTRYDEPQRLSIREVHANLPPEADFRARLASGAFVTGANSATGGLQTVTTTTTTGGPMTQVTQTQDVRSQTIPAVAAVMPSIYQMDATRNEFYSSPNLPPINVPSVVPINQPRYTPIPDTTPATTSSTIMTAPAPVATTTTTREVVVNSTAAPIVAPTLGPVTTTVTSVAPIATSVVNVPAVTNITTTSYAPGSIDHEFRSASGSIRPRVIHDYKGLDTSFNSTYSGYSPSFHSGSYSPVTYTPPGEIVSYGTSHYEGHVGSIMPNIPRGSHIVLEPEIKREYITAPGISTGSMYPSIATTQIGGGFPIAQAYPSVQSYHSIAAPMTETVVLQQPSQTFVHASPSIIAQPLVSAQNVITSVAPTTVFAGDAGATQGLRLVSSYQDPKFATAHATL